MASESNKTKRASSFGDGRGVAGLECYYYFKKGRCVWGESCKYSHLPTGRAAEEPIRDDFGTTAGHNSRKNERVYTKWQGQESPLVYGTVNRSSREIPSANRGDSGALQPPSTVTSCGSAASAGLMIRGLSAREERSEQNATNTSSNAMHASNRVSRLGAIGEPRRSRSPLRSPVYQKDWRHPRAPDPVYSSMHENSNAVVGPGNYPHQTAPSQAGGRGVERPRLSLSTESARLASTDVLMTEETSRMDVPITYAAAAAADTAVAAVQHSEAATGATDAPIISDTDLQASESTQRQIHYAVNWIQGAIEVINNLPTLVDQAVGPATIDNPGFRAQIGFEASSAAVALQPLAMTINAWGAEALDRHRAEMRRRRERMAPPYGITPSQQRYRSAATMDEQDQSRNSRSCSQIEAGDKALL